MLRNLGCHFLIMSLSLGVLLDHIADYLYYVQLIPTIHLQNPIFLVFT